MGVPVPGSQGGAAGPDRQTRVVGGEGSASISYTLPPGLFQYVESVRAVIDNTGGAAAIKPELEVATSNGVVIATTKQTESIPVGDTGGATFALRLQAGGTSTPAGGGIQFDTDNEGGWLYVQVNDVEEAGGPIRGTALDLQDRSTSVGGSGGIRLKTFNTLDLDANFGATLLSRQELVTIQSDAITAPFVNGILLRAFQSAISIVGHEVVMQDATGHAVVACRSEGALVLDGDEIIITAANGMNYGNAPTDLIGFYGAAPVAQQPQPVTLADVINLLVTLGLCAP